MPRTQRIELLVLLGTLSAFGPLSIDMYLPALPTLEVAFSAQTAQVQLTLTAFFLGFALGQGFYGPISDRFGRKPPLYVSLALYAVASLGCAFAPTVEALAVLRLIQALAGCGGGVMARAMTRDLFDPQEMRRVLSMLMLVTGVAPVLAPSIGGQLLLLFNWQAIFLLQAVIGVLCLAAVHFRLSETHPADPGRPLHLVRITQRYLDLMRNRTFLIHALVGGVSMAGMFAYIAGSPFVFIDHFHMQPEQFGLLFGVNALGLVLASQSNAHVFHAIRPERVLFWTVAVQCAAGLVLFGAAITGVIGVIAIAVPLFLYVAANGLIMPNATTLAMEPYAQDAGAASALLGMLQFLLAALSTTVIGAVEGLGEGAVPMAAVIAGCGLISFLLYLTFNRLGLRAALPIQP